jgi:hypothetical protein
MKILENAYNKVVHSYIKLFCHKQGIDFDFWIGGQIGGIASFNDWYHYNFLDIKFDIDSNQPVHRILNYFDESVEYSDVKINYTSYCMGLRPQAVIDAEREKQLLKSKENVDYAKKELENEMLKYLGHS